MNRSKFFILDLGLLLYIVLHIRSLIILNSNYRKSLIILSINHRKRNKFLFKDNIFNLIAPLPPKLNILKKSSIACLKKGST